MPSRARAALIVVAAVAMVIWSPPRPGRAASIINVPADYPTIQAAIVAAVDGDTVVVAPGTYNENLLITESITVQGFGPDVTTIDGVGGGDAAVSINTQQTVAPTLRGFRITGGGGTFGGGVYLLGAGPATIADNVIMGNTSSGSGGGIDVNGGGSSVIERNVITGNTSGYGGGISVVNTMAPVIRNNLIAGNTAASSGGGLYLSVPGGGGPQIRNNTIAGNTALTGPGIFYGGPLTTAIVQNNVITSSGQAATVSCDPTNGGTPPSLVSNDVYNPSGSEYDGTCAGTTGTGGNVSVDPRYVASSVDDYHLRADSPLIDTGTPDASVTTDIDGDARPHDGDENGTATIEPGFDEAVDPLLIDFDNPYLGGLYIGNVDVGATGHGIITVTNLGASSLSITSAAIGGNDPGDFSIAVPQDDTCSGTSVAVAASCTIKVSLIPTDIGDRDATLTITGPGPVGTRVVPVAGVGLDPILVIGGPMAFGSVNQGTTSPAKTAQVNNYGPPASVTSVTVAGANPGDFVITDDTCTGTAIPTAGACTFDVAFAPTAPGPRTATATITGPAPVFTRTIDLTGTGSAPSSGVTWGSAYRASPSYSWNTGYGLARSVQGTTQRLHGLYATDRIGGSWAKDTGPYAGVYYTRSTSGSTWTPGKRLNPSTQHAVRLGIAASGSRVYATWVSQTKVINYSAAAPRVLYLRVNTSYGDAAAWKAPIRLTSTTGRVDYPTIAASGSDVHVSWTDSVTGAVRVATSKDRGVTWKLLTVGSTTGGASSNKSGFPAIAVSGSTVAVTWVSANTGAIRTRISTDRGTTWGTTQTVASTSNGTFAVAVRGTRVAVTWTGTDGVALRQRIAGTWGSPVVVAPADGVHEQFTPAIALPDASRIGIAWTQEAATANWSDLRWVESPDGGAKWFAAQTLGSSASSSARRANDWPSIVWPVASTRYVAWNGWTANTNNYRLYIRTGIGDAGRDRDSRDDPRRRRCLGERERACCAARECWSGRWDSNPQPRAPKARAPPLRHAPTGFPRDLAYSARRAGSPVRCPYPPGEPDPTRSTTRARDGGGLRA